MATNDIVMDKVVLQSPSGRRRVALELGDDGIVRAKLLRLEAGEWKPLPPGQGGEIGVVNFTGK
jgi:hypothetical protein